jgi:hypothetical protein
MKVKRKLVQTVRKRSATDLNAKLVTNGEVRQTQTPGRMGLREVNVALGTMQGTPAKVIVVNRGI